MVAILRLIAILLFGAIVAVETWTVSAGVSWTTVAMSPWVFANTKPSGFLAKSVSNMVEVETVDIFWLGNKHLHRNSRSLTKRSSQHQAYRSPVYDLPVNTASRY